MFSFYIGERPFVCDNSACGKTFTRNEELTRHKRIHTGLRPYDCHICSKKFGRKDHLKKHQRTHEKRKLALAKNSNSTNFQQLTNSLCCLPNSSFNSPLIAKSNKLTNVTRPLSVRNEKTQSKNDTKPQKKSDRLPKLNTTTKTIGSAIDPSLSTINFTSSSQTRNGCSNNSLNNFVLQDTKQQYTNHNFHTTKPIDTTSILPLSASSISTSFHRLASNHSTFPALNSNLNNNGQRSNAMSSLFNSNQSFSNQLNQISNHSTTISPTSSECSFNSSSPVIASLSTSMNSPSLPINSPFANPSLYFNPLMLTFI